jgi:Restriction alleviation protein Lar
MNDLKPCQFCGCDAEFAFVTHYMDRAYLVVKCSSLICEAQFRKVMAKNPLDIKSKCKEAAISWNHRHNEQT